MRSILLVLSACALLLTSGCGTNSSVYDTIGSIDLVVDLDLKGLEASPQTVVAGQSVAILSNITNRGAIMARDFKMRITLSGPGYLQSQLFDLPLIPGGDTIINEKNFMIPNLESLSSQEVTVTVVLNPLDEKDEGGMGAANNTLTTTFFVAAPNAGGGEVVN